MDRILLRTFQDQVIYSCRAVALAAVDLRNPRHDNPRLWYGVQNFVIGAGNLSKAFWGAGERRYSERQPLRDSLGVTDESPLRQIRIRNDFEHLDERIERWWRESPNHNMIGMWVGPISSIGGEGLSDLDILRSYDPESGDVTFWGNELNVNSVLSEVTRILPIAEAEYRRNSEIRSARDRVTEVVYVSDLLSRSAAVAMSIIDGVTLTDCTLRGPAVLYLDHDNNISVAISEPEDAILWEVPEGSRRSGAIALRNCTMVNCRLETIGFLGSAAQLQPLRDAYRNASQNPRP